MFFLIFPIMGVCQAVGEEYHPVYDPALTISRAIGEIKIDGALDDQGWKNAAKAGNFAEYRPGDGAKPPVNTEVYITYNDEKLYVSYICYDDPSTIRATYCNRDDVGQDDNICLLIDTYGDATWAYELNVNPYGIQGDYLWTIGGGEDESFDIIWESAAKITDSGYQLEMAIPFSSLRFPDHPKQTWKIDFWRNHPRDSRRQYSWAAIDRSDPCWPCQWGTVTGIENVKPGRGVELLPSVIGFQSGALEDYSNPHSPWRNDDFDGELSVGAKYSISSGMTAEATVNPDFSQIESDEAQIDLNTTLALFYPEMRPFFQEGSDLFGTLIDAVYTRSINDPLVAAKLVGRTSGSSIAYLMAYDEHSPIMIPLREQTAFGQAGRSLSNILRTKWTLGEESHFGILLTDRRFKETGSGTVFGVDGRMRFLNSYYLHFQTLGSHIQELDDPSLIDTTDSPWGTRQAYFDNGVHTVALDGESFWGRNIYASLERQAKCWSVETEYSEESPTFRADNGFVFMNGTRSIQAWGGYTFFHDTKLFDYLQPSMYYGRVWTFESNYFKDEWLGMDFSVMLKSQTYAQIGWLISRENFRNIQFDGIRKIRADVTSNFSKFVSLAAALSYGRLIARRADPPVMGKESDISFDAYIRPTNRLSISPSYSYSRSVDVNTNKLVYEDYIIRARIAYQLSREFFIRLIAQYQDSERNWQFDPLITYKLNPLTVFYLGSTHNFIDFDTAGLKQTQQQFFFKLQYLVQI